MSDNFEWLNRTDLLKKCRELLKENNKLKEEIRILKLEINKLGDMNE